MKRIPLAAVLLIAPLLIAAGDTPHFKMPMVRDAQTKYEQAKRGYQIALKRGINLAKRDGDREEMARMEVELEAISSSRSASLSEGRLRLKLVGSQWLWEGGPLHLSIDEHSLKLSDWPKAAPWKIHMNQTIVVANENEKWTITFDPSVRFGIVVTETGQVRSISSSVDVDWPVVSGADAIERIGTFACGPTDIVSRRNT